MMNLIDMLMKRIARKFCDHSFKVTKEKEVSSNNPMYVLIYETWTCVKCGKKDEPAPRIKKIKHL